VVDTKGAWRGLYPPPGVKSISNTTFTAGIHLAIRRKILTGLLDRTFYPVHQKMRSGGGARRRSAKAVGRTQNLAFGVRPRPIYPAVAGG
jgi:hypothetical protein